MISATHPALVMLTWPQAVNLRGLGAWWAGFGAAEVQAYIRPADQPPSEATEANWKTIRRFDKLDAWYPYSLGVQWMDFGQTVSTRAIRLVITKITDESKHPHLNGRTMGGRRIWLGELFAWQPLAGAPLASVSVASPVAGIQQHPPIPVHFTLPEAGYVTFVIDDAKGNRVRNLVSDTRVPCGRQHGLVGRHGRFAARSGGVSSRAVLHSAGVRSARRLPSAWSVPRTD